MSRQYLTAIDLAARRGTDKEIGMVQQIINYAPEVQLIPGRVIEGTFTEAKVQVGITQGGAFRAYNSGVIPGAGEYEMRRFDAFYFDSELEIDEAIAKKASQYGDSLGDLQADEIAGALQAKAIQFSQQFYGGLAINQNGFPGLMDLLKIYQKVTDSRTGKPIVNYVDANPGSTNPATECVWYVWVHPQAVSFIYGGGSVIETNPWVWQYVNIPGVKGSPSLRRRALLSNISGFVGLSCAHPWGVVCIKNIDATHPWTDALSAQLDALLPAGITPTHCFATKRARALLQQQRTVVLYGSGATRPNQATIAPIPTNDVNGVPIYVTDGIQLNAAF